MGKVKSAIITALVVAAILVLGLFATLQFVVPGSGGVQKYDGFIGNIHLGREFTGDAYTMLYPEGVISANDYHKVADSEVAENGEYGEESYHATYTQVGGVYVENELVGDDLKASVAADAKIIAERFGQKGYAAYSVDVVDGYAIKIVVPTGFTYSAYTDFKDYYNATSRSESLTAISHTVQYLISADTLSLRDNQTYDGSNSLLTSKESKIFASYFKGASVYSMAGNNAIRLTLTKEGFEKLNKVITSKEGTGYLYIGETNLGLQIPMETALESETLYFQVDKGYAQDYAIAVNSVINNNIIVNSYNTDKNGSATQLVSTTSSFGRYAPVFLGVGLVIVLVAFIVAAFIIYKKLGFVWTMMSCIYALTLITALFLIGTQLTLAGVFTAILGLVLLAFSCVFVFENVRKELGAGRTFQAAVKAGYKNSFGAILDIHVVALVVSVLMTLIGVGEVAACGLIAFIATIASYVLYWFTRLMWYVLVSPAKDKFAFCGYKREVIDDED